MIIDIAWPGDNRIKEKEEPNNYDDLKWGNTMVECTKKVDMISLVTGISAQQPAWLKEIDTNVKVEHIQKT